jgi:biopolymer transport protein ExbB
MTMLAVGMRRRAALGLLVWSATVASPFAAGAQEAEPKITTPPAARQEPTLVSWFNRGGIFMYPLALCSIIGLAVILERTYSFSRARVNTRRLIQDVLGEVQKGNLDGAVETCNRTRGPIAAILSAGLLKVDRGKDAVKEAIESGGAIELSFLQRGLLVLAALVQIAPLLGFLGTVSGMIHAFAAIAAAEQVSARLVASGIEEALITTEAGLCIAIPVSVFHSVFVSRVDRYVVEMEEASIDLVDALNTKGYVR